MTKMISLKQSVSVQKQAEVSVPAAVDALIWLKTRVAKSAAPCLIFCIVFNLGINPERANAVIARSGDSLARPRFTSGWGFTNDRGFTSGRPENLPVPRAFFLDGDNGIVENAGVALFMSGLSPYLPQGSPRQSGLPDQPASALESREYQQASDQRRFPLYLEVLAGVLVCGLISWGDVMWMGRR